MPFIPAVAAAGVTWAGIGTAISVTTAVVGLAGSIYSLASGGNQQQRQQSQLPTFQAAPIPLPVMPLTPSTSLEMPYIPDVPKYAEPPIPSENIIRADQNQLKRMGQIKSAYFTGEEPYVPETVGNKEQGLNKSNTIDDEVKKTVANEILGG